MRRFGFLLLLTVAIFAGVATRSGTSEEKPAARQRPLYKNPLDVTVDEKGETARVVLTGTRTVAVVDLATGKIKEETPWPKDKQMPGPTDVSVRGLDDVSNSIDDLKRELKESGGLPDLTNLRGISYRPQELMVHQRAKFKIPTTQVPQGWVFTNVVTVFLGAGHGVAPLPCVVDEPNRGYADPSDIVVTPKSPQRVFMACAGADVVLTIDFDRLHKHSEKLLELYCNLDQRARDSYGLADDLTASRHYVIAKLPTQANPRRLGISGDGKVLVVSNYLADSLTVIDAVNLKVVKHIPLGGPEPDAARRGEILFNSARLTQFGQFSCASCHPNGGADGLNWDLTRDGVGNFKNTKALLGIKDTAPYGWLGSSPTLEDRVQGTLRTLHRYEPSKEELGDLVAYLETLSAPKAHELPPVGVEAVARGKALFDGKARCSTCHSGPAFDDGRVHNVGTGSFPDEDRFNTPSLRGLAGTAPYLHDGSAATLEEVFTKRNPKQQHGDAHKLSAEELADLIAYLKSL